MFVDELEKAFEYRLQQEGNNIRALSRKSGVNNSTVNRLNSKKADFANLPALTIQRLFPELRVFFFRSDYPAGAGVTVTGTNSGSIANGANARATVGDRREGDPLQDESTKLLLTYWRDLPPSRRFEFLMMLARSKEEAEAKK